MSRLVVSISHVEFTETDHTLYVIKVQQDADEWQVRREYSDFRRLRDDVQRVLKDDKHELVSDDASRVFARGLHDLPFPGRRLFGAKSDRVVKERAVELHHFLIKLLFLTHTYRKAQKQLYDGPDGLVNQSLQGGVSMVARPQGSASVFYLLREFLKSSNDSSGGGGGGGGSANGRRARSNKSRTDDERDDDDSDDRARRMLRESKMLAMRASQHKAMSTPQLLSQSQNGHQNGATSRPRTNTSGSAGNVSTPRRAPPPRPARPIAPEAAAAVAAAMEDLTIEPVRKSVHFNAGASTTDAMTPKPSNKTMSFKSASFTVGSHLEEPAAAQQISPVGRSEPIIKPSHKRFNDRISSAEPHPVLRAIGSDLHIIEAIPDPQPRSLSSSSTASSSASLQARSLDTGTALHASTPAPDSSHSASSSSSTRRRPRSKKKSMSASSSSLTQAEKEVRDSMRLSRLTPQLTAQTITINAQKELEKYVTEYNAIMVMRYVDRFISKAVAKTPGCYTVMGSRLVIDSARFVTELEEVFHDLPNDFPDAFKNLSGEWIFPPALDAYVQMKWDSFQTKPSSGGGKSSSARNLKHKSSSRNKGSDSDDSDSDYEYEDSGAGYMKTKQRAFTQEESDVLQMMIADGTAPRDQMLRLRRQFDEKGWHRRNNPGAKYQASRGNDDDDGSDTDDDDNGSGNESFKRFQQHQNAMRKSRMSHREDVGGLV